MSMLANYALLGVKSGGPASTAFNLSAANLGTMLQETPLSSVPVTAVTTDGNLVGLVYDQSVNAAICGTGPRLTLGSGGGRNSWLRWTLGSASYLRVLASTTYFNKFWTLNPRAGIGIHLKFMSNDGVAQTVFDNTSGSNVLPGLRIIRNSGNNMIIRGVITGSIAWTVTSTSTFNVADGWRSFTVSLGGVGTNTGLLRVYNAAGTLIESQLFNIAAGAVQNANQLGTFGITVPGLTAPADMQVALIRMWNDAVTITQSNEFALIDETRTSTFIPVIQWKFDLSDTRFIFSDAAGQVPVTNGQAVRTLRSQTIGNWNIPTNGLYQNLRRQFASADAGSSAVWVSAGDQSYLDFDGVDDNYTLFLASHIFMEELGGRWTYVRVAKNDDATNGSHLFSFTGGAPPASSGFYHTLTGSAYSVVVGSNPRQVMHPNPNVNPLNSPCENPGVDDIKISIWVRDGLNLKCYNGDGTMVEETAFSSGMSFDQWGLAYSSVGSTFNFDGRDFYIEKWNGVQDATWIANKIAELLARYP